MGKQRYNPRKVGTKASILDKIAEKAVNHNVQLSLESGRWFLKRMRSIRTFQPHRLMQEQRAKGLLKDVNTKGRVRFLGRMFSFFYEPKGKDTLTYYDKFPLVIPIQEAPGGFYGLNLHYLSYRMRMFFLSRLTMLLVNPYGKADTLMERQKALLGNTEDDWIASPYDMSTRLRFTSWAALNMGKTARYAQPTIKRYLRSHITSRLVEFHPSEWIMVAFLPTARFEGVDANEVWQLSSKGVALTSGIEYGITGITG